MFVEHFLDYLPLVCDEGQIIRILLYLLESLKVFLRVGPSLIAASSANHFMNEIPIFPQGSQTFYKFLVFFSRPADVAVAPFIRVLNIAVLVVVAREQILLRFIESAEQISF